MKKMLFLLALMLLLGANTQHASAAVQCDANLTPTLMAGDPSCWTTYTTPGYWTQETLDCTWEKAWSCCDDIREEWVPVPEGPDMLEYTCYHAFTSTYNVYPNGDYFTAYCHQIDFTYYNSCTGDYTDSDWEYVPMPPCGNYPDYWYPVPPTADPDVVINTWNPGGTVDTCYYYTVDTWTTTPDVLGRLFATGITQHSTPGTSCVSEQNIQYVLVDGACGTRNGNIYAPTDTTWLPATTFCSQGLLIPGTPEPSFPSAGGTTNWQCVGANGGASPSCSAQRVAPLTVNINSNPTPNANVGDTVTWAATVTGGLAPYTYTWSGAVSKPAVSTNSTSDSVSRVFGITGAVIESVTVSDSFGQTLSNSKSVTIVDNRSFQ